MNFILQPWQFLLLIIAGWVNREQQQVIEFLRAEVEILLEIQGRKRILLNDKQRARLAVKGKTLGRQVLKEISTIFTPDTILRWHRQLVAQKWNYSERRKKIGRPPISQEVIKLILRMAQENPIWGYDHIQGALANLGYEISDQSVGNILQKHGIEPAPTRKQQTTWSTFIKAHWDVLAAIDFTTVEIWTIGGLVTIYLLFVMELKTRRVHFAGCTSNPEEAWMRQIGRNLTDTEDGFLHGMRYVLMDRDGIFNPAFRKLLKDSGVKPVRLPPRSPNLNSHLERYHRSLKEECVNRMIFLGERSLRHAVREFLAYYHHERNHQGLHNQIINPGEEIGRISGDIQSRERLGGMLRYYYRDAA